MNARTVVTASMTPLVVAIAWVSGWDGGRGSSSGLVMYLAISLSVIAWTLPTWPKPKPKPMGQDEANAR